jgi:hypothetical protein
MPESFLGRYLVEKGAVTEAQLGEALSEQRRLNRRMGESAVKLGFLTPDQVAGILAEQEALGLPFGETAIRSGLMNRSQVEELQTRHDTHKAHLGRVMLSMGHLSQHEFERLMPAFLAEDEARREDLHFLMGGYADSGVLFAMTVSLDRAARRFLDLPVKPHRVLAPGESAPEGIDVLFSAVVRLVQGPAIVASLACGPGTQARLLDKAPLDRGDGSGGEPDLVDVFATAGGYFFHELENTGLAMSSTELFTRDQAAVVPDPGIRLLLATPEGPLLLDMGRERGT